MEDKSPVSERPFPEAGYAPSTSRLPQPQRYSQKPEQRSSTPRRDESALWEVLMRLV